MYRFVFSLRNIVVRLQALSNSLQQQNFNIYLLIYHEIKVFRIG